MKEITIRELIINSIRDLEDVSPTPKLDIEIILCHLLNIDKIKLMMSYGDIIEEEKLQSFEEMLEKRKKSMPIAYIINKKEFMGYDFYVDENVLIPRPDTELIVEHLIEKIDKKISDNSLNVLDMCTGSGAIVISAVKTFEEKAKSLKANFFAADLSEEALNVCKKNIDSLLDMDIELIQTDLFSSSRFDDLNNTFDIIVSNPPYIEEEVIASLDTDVKDYEPMMALSGGEDGMYFYNKIIEESGKYLKNGGYLIFESGHDQARKIEKKMLESGFKDIEIKKDIQNFERMVSGRFSK